MHHLWLASACVDIDGVLCIDPTAEENDDGPRYREFLSCAKPLYLPTVPVGALLAPVRKVSHRDGKLVSTQRDCLWRASSDGSKPGRGSPAAEHPCTFKRTCIAVIRTGASLLRVTPPKQRQLPS